MAQGQKPFLGGWRNIVTGLIYHNACTQTRSGGTRSRITQTVAVVDTVTDVAHDQAVQVDAIQFLPDIRDRIVAPGISSFGMPVSDEEVKSLSCQDTNRILDSVVKIQRCYRAYRARVAARMDALEVTNVARYDEANVIEHAERSQVLSAYSGTDFVILNRCPARTSSDFESLHNLLDRWRILETERASLTLLGSSRVATCGLILSKEVELLRAIDSMKTAVRLKYREQKRHRFLDELSRPIAWQDSRGRPILVDTLRVQRARQHRNVYASLSNENLSIPERVDLLHDLKHIADMHTCSQSNELVYLVDQELDLLMRRVDTSRLNWLRNRLKLSFLRLVRNALQGLSIFSSMTEMIFFFKQFIKNSKYKRDQLKSLCPPSGDVEEDAHLFDWSNASITRLCRTCGRLLSLEKFPRERRLRSSSCVYCTSMRTRKGPRVVYEPYERILWEVRRFEARMGCYGSLAFVVGAKVICRLVNKVWHGRSGISECDDLDELRLTRFRREHEWAPWNSLLLTKTEAAIHHGISDIESFYDSSLLQKFYMKNLQAKVHFESISQARRNIVTPFSSMEDE
ncbi:PREDICTED: IQ and ubiquitin-like domain-containing protein [Vollenhovia emeryi]|uniref:IQ and ubiquitin-like domain-containing protein n=1 Tax=Vollenhovia emeryi TaxID=411798 RepID=UPI0005F43375|nr:PREDICTED: IQ and ubiquitin-like domain-containing protein [Vollenhovia emeryi]